LLALAGLVGASAFSAPRPPRATSVGCIARCAGLREASVGARIAIGGRRLSRITEVQFAAGPGFVPTTPIAVGRHRVEVEVPNGARTGRPRVVDAGGRRYPAAQSLRIVSARRLPAPGSFRLLGVVVRPRKAFFDGKRKVTLSFRFQARGSVDVRLKLVHSGHVQRGWVLGHRTPYERHHLRWNGRLAHGQAARRGRYRFKLQRAGHRAHPSPAFRLYDAKLPVRGGHNYGGPVQRFGAPRTGGRVHEGQDVFASCGTPVVAARGGRVQARGSDPALYGNWVVIDGRATRADYRYAHFLRPAAVHDQERVRTGERIGRIGKTGNARTVGCQLHFEVWPRGWRRGRPVNPLPLLRRWDGWS
jgi:murein DD-endopeptidase MepM/ murein hydrolase activator NlpD